MSDILAESIRHVLNDGECADWFVRAHADNLRHQHPNNLAHPHDAAGSLGGGVHTIHDGAL